MKISSGVSLRSSALNTVQWVSLLQDLSEPLVCKSVLSSPREEGRECKCSPDMFVYGSPVFGKHLQRLGFPRTAVEKCFSSDTRIQGNNLSPKQVSQTCLAQAIHPAEGRLERRLSSRWSDPVGQVTPSLDVVKEVPRSVGFKKLKGLH